MKSKVVVTLWLIFLATLFCGSPVMAKKDKDNKEQKSSFYRISILIEDIVNKITNLQGGLVEEKSERVAEDIRLQDQIDNIEATPTVSLGQMCGENEVMVGIDEEGIIVCAVITTEPEVTNSYVFTSSTRHSGDLGGLTGANTICNELAINAGLHRGRDFKAWLSAGTYSPSVVFPHREFPYISTHNNEVIAENWDDLTDGSLNTPINYDENGNLLDDSSPYVWTGTNHTGGTFEMPLPNATEHNCSEWTNSSSDWGALGNYERTNHTWTYFGSLSCNISATNFPVRIYCFEQ